MTPPTPTIEEKLEQIFNALLADLPFSDDSESEAEAVERAKAALTLLITKAKQTAELKHSIGILDNVLQLGEHGYSKSQLLVACKNQKVELERQLKASTQEKL